jgi:Protein of unknown function (DUF4089)
MPAPETDFDEFVRVQATVLALTIDPAWRANVVGFVVMAAGAANLFADLAFDDAHDESAAVFRPIALPQGLSR